MDEQSRKTKGGEIITAPSPKSQRFGTVGTPEQWILLFADMFGKCLSGPVVYAYLESLEDIPYAELHQACARGLRKFKFMPSVAEIREEVEAIRNEKRQAEWERQRAKDRAEYEQRLAEQRRLIRAQLDQKYLPEPVKKFEPPLAVDPPDLPRFTFTGAPKSAEQQIAEAKEKGLIH